MARERPYESPEVTEYGSVQSITRQDDDKVGNKDDEVEFESLTGTIG